MLFVCCLVLRLVLRYFALLLVVVCSLIANLRMGRCSHDGQSPTFRAIFIRAPGILSVKEGVEVSPSVVS